MDTNVSSMRPPATPHRCYGRMDLRDTLCCECGKELSADAIDRIMALAALRRLASSTEMSGSGETESMTGPAAVEMRARMRYAWDAKEEIESRKHV